MPVAIYKARAGQNLLRRIQMCADGSPARKIIAELLKTGSTCTLSQKAATAGRVPGELNDASKVSRSKRSRVGGDGLKRNMLEVRLTSRPKTVGKAYPNLRTAEAACSRSSACSPHTWRTIGRRTPQRLPRLGSPAVQRLELLFGICSAICPPRRVLRQGRQGRCPGADQGLHAR